MKEILLLLGFLLDCMQLFHINVSLNDTPMSAKTKVRPLPCLVFSCFARCSRLPPEALCPAPAQPSCGHARVHVTIVAIVRVELGPCQIAIRAQTPADDEALAGAGLYIQTISRPSSIPSYRCWLESCSRQECCQLYQHPG